MSGVSRICVIFIAVPKSLNLINFIKFSTLSGSFENLSLKLDDITKYFQWTNPPKSVKGAKGILLMKKDNLEFDEIFNILADLFYYISHIIMEFKNNQK